MTYRFLLFSGVVQVDGILSMNLLLISITLSLPAVEGQYRIGNLLQERGGLLKVES